MDIILCDIDGTVADCSHRRHFVTAKPKNFKAFYGAMHLDEPIMPVIKAVRALHLSYPIVFVSGREGTEVHREITVNWLLEHGVLFSDTELFMRPAGDYRPDDVVKEEILDNEILSRGWNPIMAFDDRQRVVDMWRRRGIVCAQVAEGDF